MTVDVTTAWRHVVTAAMLGTDRRDPPAPGRDEGFPGRVADVVADATPESPSARLLTLVATMTAVRRAGILPGAPAVGSSRPATDPRPVCPVAAADRWRHLVESWPVLEDEWTVVLLHHGWRAAPELVPALLVRHRGDPVRRRRAELAAGPLAGWLVDQCPELAPRSNLPVPDLGDALRLPALPISPDIDLGDATSAAAIADGLATGRLGAPHRSMLVNAVARAHPPLLAAFGAALATVDPTAPGHAIASSLYDLATTRVRMLADLDPVHQGSDPGSDPDRDAAGPVSAGV